MIASTSEPVITTQKLRVHYRKGLRRKSQCALESLDMEVRQGEIFGFIGPNGAGKSTTIKALLGFIFPTGGEATVLGQPAGSQEAKRRLGYLPEVALYYNYLNPREILRMYGRLSGLTGQDLSERIDDTVEMVGLTHARNRLLSGFSKGMLQRVGLAQALLHDPELLILDEPASGLDPIGRRDLKNIMLELKDQGKTLFFSSHELTTVEAICDHVCILNHGKVVAQGDLNSILKPVERYLIRFRSTEGEAVSLRERELQAHQENVYAVRLEPGESTNPVVHEIMNQGGEILEVTSERGTLEDYFMTAMTANDAQHAAEVAAQR